MSELNQLLLDFDYKTNFNEHDFYLSKSNSNAFNLILLKIELSISFPLTKNALDFN